MRSAQWSSASTHPSPVFPAQAALRIQLQECPSPTSTEITTRSRSGRTGSQPRERQGEPGRAEAGPGDTGLGDPRPPSDCTLAERGKGSRRLRLKLGTPLPASKSATAPWSRARAFFLLPPGGIYLAKEVPCRTRSEIQDPGTRAHNARTQESRPPGPLFSQESRSPDPRSSGPGVPALLYLHQELKCQPLSGAMDKDRGDGPQAVPCTPTTPLSSALHSIWDQQPKHKRAPLPNLKLDHLPPQLQLLLPHRPCCPYSSSCLCPPFPHPTVVLPRPSILAKPGSVILWGRPVTFVCRGPPRVDIFRLQKRGKLSYVDVKNHLRLKTEAEFPITSVSEDTAGLYRCIYYKQSNWSKYSEFLKLEVIGAPGDISPSPTEADSVTGLSLGQRIQVQPGERPGSPSSLLTQWGPIVASAESLILQCHSDVKYDRFTLSKEGTRDLPQGLGWQPQRGNSQVDFPLGHVNRTHKGQYSGYNLSQEWLVPSDPLDILVAASTSKSYTVGNCVRMGLAGMVLLIPVVILAEAGNSQCRSQHGCMGWRQAGATRD
ncbi:uncharacterized protein LOC126086194 [Elephas maximus indicus]|uniref:uncharacterized protein LOC126086194 n=1 Tax=Elephas maximus indicus TaxID=99487 RepID=UPI002116E3C0|nr:uncharacterized protein LOC126086194 [Elephas maximus indicus]